MKNKSKLIIALSLFGLFLVWTILVKVVDVKDIGPLGSSVGFATINETISNLTPFNKGFFKFTQILGYVGIAVAAGFAVLGIVQWIKRKSFLKVDRQILVLGVAYIALGIVYLFFNIVKINYRPVLIKDTLEASYPSSHTMLALFVFTSDIPMIAYLLKNYKKTKIVLYMVTIILSLLTVGGRVASGAHWFSDIMGGVFFSFGLLYLFFYFLDVFTPKTVEESKQSESEK